MKGVHPDWKFSHCIMQGKSERELWLCKKCSKEVICISYRGQRSSEELANPCKRCSHKKQTL